jgi:hypothetical protein
LSEQRGREYGVTYLEWKDTQDDNTVRIMGGCGQQKKPEQQPLGSIFFFLCQSLLIFFVVGRFLS